MSISSPLIVALDFPDQASAVAMADRLDPSKVRVKVGKELFTRCGPAVVEGLQSRGFEVFLDLKFHDIPNTVAGAVKAAAELGVWMVNVHASGGTRMMSAAMDVLAGFSTPPLLTAVTVLTSMDAAELESVGVAGSPLTHVERLAQLAQQSGMHGVVCSAREATRLREICGEAFCLVTPGIRPVGSASDDQRRIMTPPQAQAAGVNYMVIGRPITQSQSPAKAVDEILHSLSKSAD